MELFPPIRQRFFDSNGDPLVGGKLYSYQAGTSTPKATYTSRDGLSANTNPIILDANGECDLWGEGSYKFILTDADDVQQWSKDNVSIATDAALASAFWRGVRHKTSADSPYTVTQDDNGYLIALDSSGGPVSINLPEQSSLSLPFNLGIRLMTAGNDVTINRDGSDTIEGSTSKILSAAGTGYQFIADISKSPDDWIVQEIGTFADGSVTAPKLAYHAVNGQTAETSPAAGDEVLIADVSASALRKMTRNNFLKHVIRTASTTDSSLNTDEAVHLNGASFTVTLPTAVGIAGKVIVFVHTGTSDTQLYTIDGNGSETVAGQANYVMRKNGQVLKLQSDGTNWVKYGGSLLVGKTFLTSESLTVPPLVTAMPYEGCGGGGGGGGSSNNGSGETNGGGGGGGGGAPILSGILKVTPGDSLSVAIGAGGTAGAGGNGGNGGETTVTGTNVSLTLPGGSGGGIGRSEGSAGADGSDSELADGGTGGTTSAGQPGGGGGGGASAQDGGNGGNGNASGSDGRYGSGGGGGGGHTSGVQSGGDGGDSIYASGGLGGVNPSGSRGGAGGGGGAAYGPGGNGGTTDSSNSTAPDDNSGAGGGGAAGRTAENVSGLTASPGGSGRFNLYWVV